ncbi:MAG TPA: hypothetical protein VML57_18465 [Burkholderiales bacterium]|nr:hypothetical protein [Burkholderiales bacterium]
MLRVYLLGAALCAAIPASPAQDAEALRARHEALREELADNQFGRPLHVESSGASGRQEGEIFAAIETPYGTVGPALERMEHWCDILLLPVNVKYCESSAGTADTLSIFVARKPYDALDEAYRVDFSYQAAAASTDYLHVALRSPSGPFGTRDYRISLQAAPLDARRTFLHMSYSYRPGIAARMAMRFYLATSGRDKVGFSVVDRLPDGRPVYVDGVRGVVERNTMRYYLAVEAYLGALNEPRGQRLEKRLRDWHAAIERHPQLRELERDEYLKLKRWETLRQEVGVVPDR